MNSRYPIVASLLLATAFAQPAPTSQPAPRPKSDAAGNPLRYAASGHVSNYDEAKVAPYTLPDPLVMTDGRPVRDAAMWMKERRPEILRLYQDFIFGHVPATAPKITFAEVKAEPALDGKAVRKTIVGRIGEGADAPTVTVSLWLPAAAKGPVPVLLHVQFFANQPPAPGKEGAGRFSEDGPISDFIARGYAYAVFRYTEIEGDKADTSVTRVRKLALAPGQEKPAARDWSTISAWSWGASRILDYLETVPAVDAKRVALIGHSRLGKTALWGGATDPRFAVIFASCSGEMGAALSRRDWGETVDDMAVAFPWWFVGTFPQYVGKWSTMPVDAHLLIALSAPRPVFVTGGTQDQWADPKGEFLAQVAAGPVYRLLGRKDLGTTELPPLDHPLIAGDLGFLYHTGGHTIAPGDWKAFLEFAGRYLKP
jgi:hypothetical protein